MPLEQLGVKCLAQGHNGVTQWIPKVSHTIDVCLIHYTITNPHDL